MNRAFTLLEVILALAVVALVMAALAPALVGALRAERQARAIIGPLAEEPPALAILRDDLIAMPRPGDAVGSGLSLASTSELAIASQEVDGRRAATVTMLSLGAPPVHPSLASRVADAGQAAITWSLRQADDGHGLVWIRQRQVHVLATGTVPTPAEEVMLDHLAWLTVEALSGDTWLTDWDSAENATALPQAVRITWAPLAADGGAGPSRSVLVDLPLGGA